MTRAGAGARVGARAEIMDKGGAEAKHNFGSATLEKKLKL